MKRFYLVFFILTLDILSKFWIHTHLSPMQWAPQGYPYGGIGIFQNFLGVEASIVHVMNKGAAWGILSSMHLPLLIGRIVISLGLLIYLLRFPTVSIALFLIFAGALGNVLDCFFYGHVIDMVYLKFGSYSFAVFNIADSCITIGAFWFILKNYFVKRHAT